MTVTLSIILVLSITINILLLWYISYALRKLLFVSDNIGELLKQADDFAKHLEEVHELETFYGDTTLQNLIAHSRKIVEDIKQFEEIYRLTEEGVEIEDAETEG
tara:strand:- start:712 stop:1023 length:312 start_codon:yes stop_codon:yes gene_type:complete